MASENDGFLSGVWSSIQILVVVHDQPALAASIAHEHDIEAKWARAEQRRSGYENKVMNIFIRQEMA